MALAGLNRQYNLASKFIKAHWTAGCYQCFTTCLILNSYRISRRWSTGVSVVRHRSKWMMQKILLNKEAAFVLENKIVDYLAVKLNLPINFVLYHYLKFPMRTHLQLKNVKLTFMFLKQHGFHTSVIGESISICFYPRENIEKALKEIAKNEKELSEFQFHNGRTHCLTRNFSNGTVSKDKRLQLCLYYMELPYEFSGHGYFVT